MSNHDAFEQQYQSPQESPALDIRYAGFWVRLGASILDSLLLVLITMPILLSIYGMEYLQSGAAFAGNWDIVINYVFPVVWAIAFWVYFGATPGKMAVKVRIVDARTGNNPSLGQYVIRYIGYIVSAIPLFLGFLWVAFDKRKQGFHDKMANTVVIHHA